ncbi:hypothetical protein TKK_0012945 [Trichogramma kaykai]|uniref:Uncharacterized protein n=1 Tax=Trichogramma kaykai TaxID=54128 RepID=A0ABD2WK46_9HYME
MNKIHLLCGVSINQDEWNDIFDIELAPRRFVTKLSSALWTDKILRNRALQVSRCKYSVSDQSPRKPLSPRKRAALRGCYLKFLRLKFRLSNPAQPTNSDKKKILKIKEEEKKLNSYLSHYIDDLVKQVQSDDSSGTEEDYSQWSSSHSP